MSTCEQAGRCDASGVHHRIVAQREAEDRCAGCGRALPALPPGEVFRLQLRLRHIAQDDALYGPSDGRTEERNRILDTLSSRRGRVDNG